MTNFAISHTPRYILVTLSDSDNDQFFYSVYCYLNIITPDSSSFKGSQRIWNQCSENEDKQDSSY